MSFVKSLVLFLFFSFSIFAQNQVVEVDVVSEEDLTPGVVKALPDYEKVKEKAAHITNPDELRKAFNGERGVLDLIDFKSGNDAATADYSEGKLLIVEFASPQTSFETDNQIKERLNQTPVASLFYRRIGNYNVFLFDGKDETSANELLGKIKYEKTVKWLGEDPFQYNRAERHFVQSTLQLFLSTILAITAILGTVLVLGIAAGVIYFRVRNKNREEMTKFSDAGGMIRLNLDELTPDVTPDRLLKG
jgi:hypothetical protein